MLVDYDPTNPETYISPDLLPFAKPIDEARPAVTNSLIHTHDDLSAIADSLREFGQREPLFLNTNNNEIASGNGRWLAAKNLLGWSHIAMIGEPDTAEVSRRYNIATNATGRIAEFNFDTLKLALDPDAPIPGITPSFLKKIQANLPADEPEEPPEPKLKKQVEGRPDWPTFSIRIPQDIFDDLNVLLSGITGEENWERFANLITIVKQVRLEQQNAGPN